MKVVTHDEILVGEVVQAFTDARDDVLAEAQRRARGFGKTGKFEHSLEATAVTQVDGRLVARVGSPLISAKAKELGAYIEPKRAKWLTFMGREGHLVRVDHVRLPKRPAVVPAGRLFKDFMKARLQAARR